MAEILVQGPHPPARHVRVPRDRPLRTGRAHRHRRLPRRPSQRRPVGCRIPPLRGARRRPRLDDRPRDVLDLVRPSAGRLEAIRPVPPRRNQARSAAGGQGQNHQQIHQRDNCAAHRDIRRGHPGRQYRGRAREPLCDGGDGNARVQSGQQGSGRSSRQRTGAHSLGQVLRGRSDSTWRRDVGVRRTNVVVAYYHQRKRRDQHQNSEFYNRQHARC
mmetsp:Transcript_37035/g.110913  ORF Transcript_37035/g.110913 Transcript_37035/m.110913 type:complete len:216 (+) Transcript_37035:376-1023(+)